MQPCCLRRHSVPSNAQYVQLNVPFSTGEQVSRIPHVRRCFIFRFITSYGYRIKYIMYTVTCLILLYRKWV